MTYKHTVEILDALNQLKQFVVRVIFEQEELDTTKTDSDLLISIFKSFVQPENESRSDNIKVRIKYRASARTSKLYDREKILLWKKIVKETIHAKGFDIGIYTNDFQNEFISLTDIAKYRSEAPNYVIKNWMRNCDTIEFLGLWEGLHNSDSKPIEFDGFRNQAGLNAFTMSPTKWIEGVNAIRIVTKAGRYGGTYASWISAGKYGEL